MDKNKMAKMHSAEHILNQTMVRMFDKGRCFSAHINEKKSKCDYHFDRELNIDEVRELENKVNEVIKNNLKITEENVLFVEAEKLYNLERLPQKEETLRIIKIGDYDACPCIGEHVKFTKEIGDFKIISSDFNEGVLRIRYKLS